MEKEETKEVTIESESSEKEDQPEQLKNMKLKTLDGTVYDFEFTNPEVNYFILF